MIMRGGCLRSGACVEAGLSGMTSAARMATLGNIVGAGGGWGSQFSSRMHSKHAQQIALHDVPVVVRVLDIQLWTSLISCALACSPSGHVLGADGRRCPEPVSEMAAVYSSGRCLDTLRVQN